MQKGSKLFLETYLNNWCEITQLSIRFLSRFVYRGQACSDWKLSSSLERLVKRYHPEPLGFSTKAYFYEQDMLKDFMWKYPIYEKVNIPGSNEIIEWLSLMQHYGSPTRMVDFTYSPYVALFMALDNSDSPYSAIWCLNKNVCKNPFFLEFYEETGQNSLGADSLDKIIYKKANNTLNGNKEYNTLKIFLVRPNRINERLNRQQGLFAIPNDISKSFEEHVNSLLNDAVPQEIPFCNLVEYSNTSNGKHGQEDIALIKIKIPSKLRYDIAKSLEQMNITAETMYPGIEGLAKSMAIPRFDF